MTSQVNPTFRKLKKMNPFHLPKSLKLNLFSQNQLAVLLNKYRLQLDFLQSLLTPVRSWE
jgi:hypothetical protein